MNFRKVLTYIALISSVYISADASLERCTTITNVETIVEPVYYGWPFTLDFDILFDGRLMSGDHYTLENAQTIELLVLAGTENTTVFNQSEMYGTFPDDEYPVYPSELLSNHQYIFNVSQSSPSTYYLILVFHETNFCLSITYNLNASNFIPRTCAQSLAQNMTVFISHSNGDSVNLPCQAPVSQLPRLNIPSSATYRWTRNCGELQENIRDQHNNSVLNIALVSYNDSGIYDCAIEYNGITRYVTHIGICVRAASELTRPEVTCNTQTLIQEFGNDVILRCVGTVGIGTTDFLHLTASWNKSDSSDYECTHAGDLNETFIQNNRVSCRFFYETNENTCYNNPPSYNPENSIRRLVYELKIRNTQEADIGVYTFTLESNLLGTNATNGRIFLGLNPTPEQEKIAKIVGSCLGVLFVLLLLGAVLWWKQFYLKLFWKRKFAKPITDNMTNHAYLSYHYEINMPSQEQDIIRGVRTLTVGVLNDLGYDKIFDSIRHREIGGDKAQGIRTDIRESHRLIVILTTEYMREDQHLSELYEGLLVLVQLGKEIIFILPRGVRRFIRNRSRIDTRPGQTQFQTIHRALQQGHVVEWSNGSNFDEKLFKDKLEYYMPKLQRNRVELNGGYNNRYAYNNQAMEIELQQV